MKAGQQLKGVGQCRTETDVSGDDPGLMTVLRSNPLNRNATSHVHQIVDNYFI